MQTKTIPQLIAIRDEATTALEERVEGFLRELNKHGNYRPSEAGDKYGRDWIEGIELNGDLVVIDYSFTSAGCGDRDTVAYPLSAIEGWTPDSVVTYHKAEEARKAAEALKITLAASDAKRDADIKKLKELAAQYPEVAIGAVVPR